MAKPAIVVLHVSNRFVFELPAPLQQVAPLFGPDGERVWAGDEWDPQFLHPQPGRDTEGAVFTIQNGPYTSIWLNTLFDLAKGSMQYVYIIPDVLATTITVNLSSVDANTTSVNVLYVRTALTPAANDVVGTFAERDRTSGPEWQESIRQYLRSSS